jgi:regulator of protease activity HflC (stomatin/prohibitin superfamily)
MENNPTTLTIVLCIYGSFLLILLISLFAAIRIVREDKRLDVYRLGRYIGQRGPGLVILFPFIDRGQLKEVGTATDMPVQRLVGASGETRTTVFTSGKVLINGEEWHATSQSVISAGRRVRVVKTILEVEEE